MKDVSRIRYFNPSELLSSPTAQSRGIANWPCDFGVYRNLYLLAFYLDVVRSKYGAPIVITSGYRSPALNKAVGGVNNSKHLRGIAVDIRVLHNADYEKNAAFYLVMELYYVKYGDYAEYADGFSSSV